VNWDLSTSLPLSSLRRTERWCRAVVLTAAYALLAGCASSNLARTVDPKYGVSTSARVVEPGEPVPKGGGVYRVGRPYMVAGRTYFPEENTRYVAEGMASWYGDDFHGRLTANGEVFDMNAISAAHPTLPMPCYVRVTNLTNHRSLIVRVNDRGPYHQNRLIDVSGRAAQLLGFRGNGVAPVRVEYVGRAPLEGSDDRMLVATFREGQPAPAPSLVMVASAQPFGQGDAAIPIRRRVPIPPDRPFSLGEPVASADAESAASEPAARRPYYPGSAVTSYAPQADPVLSAGPVEFSGHGLY
jgi:rare lipoprotein A